MACEQSDKQNEEKFNSSVINSVACKEVFQCQPSGREMIAFSHPVFQSDWQTATSGKTLQFAHIIHSHLSLQENAWMIFKAAVGHVKWKGLLLGGTGEVEGGRERESKEERERGDG